MKKLLLIVICSSFIITSYSANKNYPKKWWSENGFHKAASAANTITTPPDTYTYIDWWNSLDSFQRGAFLDVQHGVHAIVCDVLQSKMGIFAVFSTTGAKITALPDLATQKKASDAAQVQRKLEATTKRHTGIVIERMLRSDQNRQPLCATSTNVSAATKKELEEKQSTDTKVFNREIERILRLPSALSICLGTATITEAQDFLAHTKLSQKCLNDLKEHFPSNHQKITAHITAARELLFKHGLPKPKPKNGKKGSV